MRGRWVVVGAIVAVGMLAGVAYATSASDAQANDPQVAGDATSNTTARFPTNKSNEPTIAVDPLNPSALIAAANDEQLQPPCGPGPVRGTTAARNDCSFFPGVGTSGVYTSSDGGSTWTNRGLLPGFSDDGGSLQSDGDPVIVFGPEPATGGGFTFANGARAYYASLAEYAPGQQPGQQVPELLTVSTSDDDGVTWSNPVIAAGANGYVFNDKEAIWADRNPASPFFGRVYVTWTQFRDPSLGAEPVMVTYSADGGQTWSSPNQLSIAQNYAFGGRQGSVVKTGPDGTVYVLWEDSDTKGYKHVVAVSHDGGVTFSKPITIAYMHDITSPIPGASFRTDSFASAAVDQNNGTVYVAWSDLRNGVGQIVVARSTNQGRTWAAPVSVGTTGTGYAFFQGLDVAPNGRVDVAWQALKAKDPSTYGIGNASIDSYYAASTNGGVSWSRPVKVSKVSSDPAASAQNNLQLQFWGDYNTLVSTNTFAWFIYTDSRNGQGCAAVDAYQHALDGTGPSAPKPAPEDVCPAQFGNTDTFVSKIRA